MRRSSAPSSQSLHPAKRRKFVAPFKATLHEPIRPQLVNSEKLDKSSVEVEASNNYNAGTSCSTKKTGPTKYYNVIWCKASKKKHKTWDGDGILTVNSRSVSLKDSEGKDIGQSSGFKSTELDNLAVGSLLFVGNKEIEIIDQISEELFKSGQCFIQSTQENKNTDANKTIPNVGLPFKSPIFSSKENLKESKSKMKQQANVEPRHSPNAVNAIVMPRPSASHQWLHNKPGLPVVDVVLDPYISTHLRPHQINGVIFLYKCVMGMGDFNGNGAILADEMGLGKTLQCITLIWTLLKQGPYCGRPVIRRCLIVTPGSLVKNWCVEFRKWLGNERLKTFPVGSDKRVEEFEHSTVYPVMIVSYEMLLRCISDVKNIKFDLVICDEAHRLKNFGIKTSSAITGLEIKKMILLTGTPIQNDLKEFYALGQLCNPGIFGTLSSFRQIFENPINKAQQPNCNDEEEELGKKRASELKRLSDLFILRRTSDVNKKYLPGKVELAVFCSISSLQRKLYEKIIASRAVKSCFAVSCNASKHLVCISVLKKLCNHPQLVYESVKDFERGSIHHDDDFDEMDSLYEGLADIYPKNYDATFEIVDCGKIQVLNRLLDGFKEVNEKAVIVSNSTKALDLFERLLMLKDKEFLRLDGQTSTEGRQKLVDQFNSKNSNVDIFLLSSKAGGTGLNLIGASRLILYDVDWNPANDIQAMARIWRDGQTKKVYIYRLLSTGTIEEKIFQRQISKQSLSGSIVDLKMNNVNFSREDLRDLFTLQDSTTCSTHELIGCHCTYLTQQINPNVLSDNETRPNQLGINQSTFEKTHLSMAQLMSWSHIQPGDNERLKDEVLKRSLQNVTFIFQNQSNP